MRLFIDAHVFDDSLQGSRTYLTGLYKELINTKQQVCFFFGAYNVNNLKEEFGKHPNVRFIKYYTRCKFLRLIFVIPYIIIKHKIDISHFQYISPLFRLSKEIVTIHDVLFLDFPDFFPWWYRFQNRFLFKRSAKRADYLLTVSGYSQERIARHFRINREEIHVIANGIAEDFFITKGQLPDIKAKYNLDKYLLYVSRIEPRKNHFLLLKAFVEMNLWKEGYKLVFIGSTSIKAELFNNYLNALPEEIARSIVLAGSSKGNELKSFYKNCSLFVYPSLAEGFGIPPLEAVASNVPVLCSRATAMSDFSFLEEHLFDPESIDELKKKISLCLKTDKNELADYAEFVKINYSWKKSAEKFVRIIFRDDLA